MLVACPLGYRCRSGYRDWFPDGPDRRAEAMDDGTGREGDQAVTPIAAPHRQIVMTGWKEDALQYALVP